MTKNNQKKGSKEPEKQLTPEELAAQEAYKARQEAERIAFEKSMEAKQTARPKMQRDDPKVERQLLLDQKQKEIEQKQQAQQPPLVPEDPPKIPEDPPMVPEDQPKDPEVDPKPPLSPRTKERADQIFKEFQDHIKEKEIQEQLDIARARELSIKSETRRMQKEHDRYLQEKEQKQADELARQQAKQAEKEVQHDLIDISSPKRRSTEDLADSVETRPNKFLIQTSKGAIYLEDLDEKTYTNYMVSLKIQVSKLKNNYDKNLFYRRTPVKSCYEFIQRCEKLAEKSETFRDFKDEFKVRTRFLFEPEKLIEEINDLKIKVIMAVMKRSNEEIIEYHKLVKEAPELPYYEEELGDNQTPGPPGEEEDEFEPLPYENPPPTGRYERRYPHLPENITDDDVEDFDKPDFIKEMELRINKDLTDMVKNFSTTIQVQTDNFTKGLTKNQEDIQNLKTQTEKNSRDLTKELKDSREEFSALKRQLTKQLNEMRQEQTERGLHDKAEVLENMDDYRDKLKIMEEQLSKRLDEILRAKPPVKNDPPPTRTDPPPVRADLPPMDEPPPRIETPKVQPKVSRPTAEQARAQQEEMINFARTMGGQQTTQSSESGAPGFNPYVATSTPVRGDHMPVHPSFSGQPPGGSRPPRDPQPPRENGNSFYGLPPRLQVEWRQKAKSSNIEHFDGDVRKWSYFKGAMELMINSEDFPSDKHKAVRLKEHLKGKALRDVSHLVECLDDFTYEEMWRILEDNYGGLERIINIKTEMIMALPRIKKMEMEELREYRNKLASFLTILSDNTEAQKSTFQPLNILKCKFPDTYVLRYKIWQNAEGLVDNIFTFNLWLKKIFEFTQHMANYKVAMNIREKSGPYHKTMKQET